MILIGSLLFIAWALSGKLLAKLIPSESVATLLLVGLGVLILFQLGELG